MSAAEVVNIVRNNARIWGDVESRWRSFTYDEIITRDKTSLGIFWQRDELLENTVNLPAPAILAAEIV